LRRYDVQARWAFLMALGSVVPLLVAAGLTLRNFRADVSQIVYGSRSSFVIGFVAFVLLSMIPSGLALLMGMSSAGQRRNDKPTHAWVGFFLGGIVLTLNLILLIAFYKLRLVMPT
jgi:uncharacterized membrane protein YdcZ (DUF606 family)